LNPRMDTLCSMLSCITARGDQHTHVRIEETDRNAQLKSITLEASPGDWFAFAPGKGRGKMAQMSPLLIADAIHRHHCACDAVVLTLQNRSLVAVYIDLKSGNPHGYSAQFKSTRQFVRYALGLLEEFHGVCLGELRERYVIFYGGRNSLLDKRPTVPQRASVSNSRPDSAHKRQVANGTRLYLREFLA